MNNKAEQSWFEMKDVRRKVLDKSVWIPLRAMLEISKVGEYGHEGHSEEFFGAGSLAVSLDQRPAAQKLDWMDVGISHHHRPYTYDGKYISVDNEKHDEVDGIRLVINQAGNGEDSEQWHLNPDLVTGLALKQEGDVWVAMNEGYEEVIRLRRSEFGSPRLLEIRADYLKDYLCARGMALYMTSYRSRVQIVGDASHILWPEGEAKETTDGDRWEGRAYEIHEGGTPFGAKTAVFHVARTDIDASDDVPVMDLPGDDNVRSNHWTVEDKGKKLVRIQGELWRSEWIEPGASSPRVREDRVTPTTSYIIDASGTRESAANLVESGRWLWFRPEVIAALAHRRGGALGWYTRDTGAVACSPYGGSVHFGMNDLGLVTVYAKDVAALPEWQQRIWAGFNVGPDGGVSKELLASQAEAQPADTLAPEAYLERSLQALNAAISKSFGITIIRDHEKQDELLKQTHRFRAADQAGLFSLAKDVTRLTVERIDAAALQQIVAPPKNEKWGSLKSLEKVLAKRIGDERARRITGPLVGAYELRHPDAHLPSEDLSDALKLLGIDSSVPYPLQGRQLLHACVSAIFTAAEVLGKNPSASGDVPKD